MRTFCSGELRKLLATQGQLKCCIPECKQLFLDSEVLRVGGNDLFESFLQAKNRVMELAISKDAEARLNSEIDRLMKMDADQREVEHLRREIVNKVLNLSCPRCGLVFVDFSDCFALTCSRCNCGFCAWCLQDCGDDAHAHVANCPHNITPGRAVFGDFTLWRQSNQQRTQRKVEHKLRDASSDRIRAAVMVAIQRDLLDLGIGVSVNPESKIM